MTDKAIAERKMLARISSGIIKSGLTITNEYIIRLIYSLSEFNKFLI